MSAAKDTAIRSDEAVANACRLLLDAEPVEIERPGGGRRRSVRIRLESGPVIVTRRSSRNRGRLELEMLRRLRPLGAGVPGVLAFDDGWLVQEDLGTHRLSHALARANGSEAEAWLAAALDSLAAIHRAGRGLDLASRVARIGARSEWRQRLVALPAR